MAFTELQKVLDMAVKNLKENPSDAGHDYDHHLSVVLNCVQILQKEKLRPKLQPDQLEAIQIAAWWHDYLREDEAGNDQILNNAMKESGYEEDYIDKVLSVKNSHTYGTSQLSIESQILFDADKLEYLSTRRYNIISIAVKNGEMSMETLINYKKAFRQRIGNIRDQLHFESSKKMFDKRFQSVIEYTNSPVNDLWTDLLEVV